MSRDFIGIKSLEGELKISHKLREFGMTVSTLECVLQKPHVNYHIKLADILSIIPFHPTRAKTVSISSQRSVGSEFASLQLNLPYYRFYVTGMTVHNRSGTFQWGSSELIIPVIPELLQMISQYGGMQQIDLH